MPRIIDAIFIDDEGADQAAELDQGVPVAPVTSEPRGLDRDDGADAAFTDRREQLLKAGTGNPRAGTAEVIVNDFHHAPAQGTRTIDQPILPTSAFVIIEKLITG